MKPIYNQLRGEERVEHMVPTVEGTLLLKTEPKVLYALDKPSTTKLYPQPFTFVLRQFH